MSAPKQQSSILDMSVDIIKKRIENYFLSNLKKHFKKMSLCVTIPEEISHKIDDKLTNLIKEQLIPQIEKNIIQHQNKTPTKSNIEFLHLEEKYENCQNPFYRYFISSKINYYEGNTESQSIPVQFEITLPHSFTVGIFFNTLTEISKHSQLIYTPQATKLLINFFAQIIDSHQIYHHYLPMFEIIQILVNENSDQKDQIIQLIAKFKENLDEINDSDLQSLNQCINSKCEKLLDNMLDPISYKTYIQFRKMINLTENYSKKEFQNEKNAFIVYIFTIKDDYELKNEINEDLYYNKELFELSIETIEKFEKPSNREYVKKKPENVNEVTIYGISMYYICIFLRDLMIESDYDYDSFKELIDEMEKDDCYIKMYQLLENLSFDVDCLEKSNDDNMQGIFQFAFDSLCYNWS